MHEALRAFFEEQVQFRLGDAFRTPIDGSVFIGDTEFLPVETLREDPDAYQVEFSTWFDEVWVPEQRERRDEILALHANRKRFGDLHDAFERQQVLPLVGSGMSVPSGLPTWSDLLRAIRPFTTVDAVSLEALLSTSAFEEAADLLAGGTNSNLLNERVEHELRLEDSTVIDGAVRLLPALFPSLVITTNLDDVLERYYGNCSGRFDEVLAGRDIARYRNAKSPTRRFLLKLHGDCRRPESRVLHTHEYAAAYATGGVVREELALLYRTNSILFMGCSLGPDRTVQLIAEIATSDKGMPKHYAFLPLPSGSEARVARELFLSQRGIYPIWYDGPHDECLLALLAGLL